MDQTEVEKAAASGKGHEVEVKVNRKTVVLHKKEITGLEVKEAAIAQDVSIQLGFILVREAEHGHPAEQIDDDQEIKVDKHTEFSCNDGDDDA